MSEKVYCTNCKYRKKDFLFTGIYDACTNKNNGWHHWLSARQGYCKISNQNNDCKYFEEKEKKKHWWNK